MWEGHLFDIVLCNDNFTGDISGSQWVAVLTIKLYQISAFILRI